MFCETKFQLNMLIIINCWQQILLLFTQWSPMGGGGALSIFMLCSSRSRRYHSQAVFRNTVHLFLELISDAGEVCLVISISPWPCLSTLVERNYCPYPWFAFYSLCSYFHNQVGFKMLLVPLSIQFSCELIWYLKYRVLWWPRADGRKLFSRTWIK